MTTPKTWFVFVALVPATALAKTPPAPELGPPSAAVTPAIRKEAP